MGTEAFIYEKDGEVDIRFSQPSCKSKKVILTYEERDRILTGSIEDVRRELRVILNDKNR